MPVVVGEGELRAGVRMLAADDHARTVGPTGQVEVFGELGDVTVLARLAVGVERWGPGRLGQGEDRAAHALGEVKADREPDPAVAAEVQQLMGQAGAVGPHQDRLGLCEGFEL